MDARHQTPDTTVGLYLRVFKAESVLEVWESGDHRYGLLETVPILAWSGELGPKLAEGDLQAPEGFYTVEATSLNPRSKYHRSFDLGFPNTYDRARQRTGSHLMVHGGAESVGCYAIGDEAIEWLFDRVADVTADGGVVPVHCYPFRMTLEQLTLHARSPWIEFWQFDLAPAYLWFEETRRLPIVDEHYRLVGQQ